MSSFKEKFEEKRHQAREWIEWAKENRLVLGAGALFSAGGLAAGLGGDAMSADLRRQVSAKAAVVQQDALAYTKEKATKEGWAVSEADVEKIVQKYHDLAREVPGRPNSPEIAITFALNQLTSEQPDLNRKVAENVLLAYIAKVKNQPSAQTDKTGVAR